MKAEQWLAYVVLHHTGHGPAHFDLMVEREPAGPLLTWRLEWWPAQGRVPADPLPAHRRDYLEYEGPISGERGEVRRVASGRCMMEPGGNRVRILRFESGVRLELETPLGSSRDGSVGERG